MTFTRNKLDVDNETLLNKLVEFGGDITYSKGGYFWMAKYFLSTDEMKKYMEYYK